MIYKILNKIMMFIKYFTTFFTLIILLILSKTNAEMVKLYLHEKVNFAGTVTELSFNSCKTIPLRFINHILSVRSEDCIILYENDNCMSGSGATMRLTSASPTRVDLKSLNFNLGSAKPCSVLSNSQTMQSHDEYVDPKALSSSDSREEEQQDGIESIEKGVEPQVNYEDNKYHTTGRSRHYFGNGHIIGVISDEDYGERPDTDNEPDDDNDNNDKRNANFRSTTKSPGFPLLDEITINGTALGFNTTNSNSNSNSTNLEFVSRDNEKTIAGEKQKPEETGEDWSHENKNNAKYDVGLLKRNENSTSTEIPEKSTLSKYENLTFLTTNTSIGVDSGEEVNPIGIEFPEAVLNFSSTEFPIIKPTSTTTPRPINSTNATTTMNPTTKKQSTSSKSASTTTTSTTTTTNLNPSKATTFSTSPIIFTTTNSHHDLGDCNTTLCTNTNNDYGMDWEVCAPFSGYLNCPGNSTGMVYWECLDNDLGENTQPNYNNCTAEWITEIDKIVDHKQDLQQPIAAENILSQILENINTQPTSTGPEKKGSIYFGHEIEKIVSLVDTTVQKSSGDVTEVHEFERICEKTVNIMDTLLLRENAWEQLNQKERSTVATHLIDSIETTMLSLGKIAEQNPQNKMKAMNYQKTFEEFSVLRVKTGYFIKSSVEEQYFNQNVEKSSFSLNLLDININLPHGWENTIDGQIIRFVNLALDFDYSSQLLPAENNRLGHSTPVVLGSEIIGMTIANELSNKTVKVKFPGEGVKINFNLGDRSIASSTNDKSKKAYGKPICAYWDPENLFWSTNGCKLIQSNATNAICECQHLTLFAVLMDAYDYTNYVNDAALYSLTIVLCTLSSICLLFTIIILKIFRTAKSPSTSITIQLCICLLIGNILIISVLDRNNFNLNDATCAIAAATIHYFLLCVFVWMAIEGFIVLKMVLDVFNTGTEHKLVLSCLAYGIPLVIVSILSVLHFLGIQKVYGDEMFCWLEGYYILAFIVPVSLVVLGNGVALAVAIKVAHQADRKYTDQVKKKVKSFRTWIIGTSALTSILGLTWIFGFLLLIGNPKFSRIASYIFTVFNASQGIFIFIFHCLLNHKVQTALKHRLFPKSRAYDVSRTDSRRTNAKSRSSISTSNNESGGRRTTELTSTGGDEGEKHEINVNIDKEESEDEIEARRRFLRSRSEDSDEFSRKPAFLKYLDQNQGRKKSNDPAFM